jgi:hypothetical protein
LNYGEKFFSTACYRVVTFISDISMYADGCRSTDLSVSASVADRLKASNNLVAGFAFSVGM